jgi:hypothetical protein
MEIIGFCIKMLDSEWKLLDFVSKCWILNGNYWILFQNVGF